MNDPAWLDEFVEQRRLPAQFRDDALNHLAAVAAWLAGRSPGTTGLSGAQGTGKTTIGTLLVEMLERDFGQRVVLLSLDDFYLSRQERDDLAARVHPLFATRGVPGTHDMDRLQRTLDALAAPGGTVRIPVFDKALDDRLPESEWRRVELPIDHLILEGWCVGATAEPESELEEPINTLEREEDSTATWRRAVNEQLRGDYALLNASLDSLLYLEAPGMDSVRRWRTQQEHQLIASRGDGMSDADLARFIEHFERITRRGLRTLPSTADVVVELDDAHTIAAVTFSRGETP